MKGIPRPPRFRLRTLLALVSLAAAALAFVADLRRSAERANHAQLEKVLTVQAWDAERIARLLEAHGDHKTAASLRRDAARNRKQAAWHARQRRPEDSPWGPPRQVH